MWTGKPSGLSGLVLGQRLLGAILHSSNEPGELSQWLCHDDSTINIVVIIIFFFYIKLVVIYYCVVKWLWTSGNFSHAVVFTHRQTCHFLITTVSHTILLILLIDRSCWSLHNGSFCGRWYSTLTPWKQVRFLVCLCSTFFRMRRRHR